MNSKEGNNFTSNKLRFADKYDEEKHSINKEINRNIKPVGPINKTKHEHKGPKYQCN